MDDLTPYQRHALEKASERRNGFGIPVVVGSLGALYFYASGATLGALGAGLATFGYIQQKRKEADEITLAVRTGAPIPHLPELAGLLPPAPTTTQAQQTGVNVEVVNTPTFSPVYNPSITINTPETVQAPTPMAPVPVVVSPTPSRFATGSGIPDEDPSHLIAACNHALIVAATDTGKTTSVLASIRRKYEMHNGHCQFWISDPKGSKFLGLEKTGDYLFLQKKSIAQVIRLLEQAFGELERRIGNRRATGQPTNDPYLTLVLDEWFTTLIMLGDKPSREKACSIVDQILATGREDRVAIWMVTQSHLASQIGLSTLSRNNMETFALGRALNLTTVRRAISDSYLVEDPHVKAKLQEHIRDYEGQEIPICFTTSGIPRVMQVPDLRGYIDWSYPLKTPKEPEPDFVIDLPPDPRNLSPQQELQVRSEIIEAIRCNPDDKWGAIKDIFGLSKGGGDKQKAASTIYDECLATLGV